MKIYLVGPRNPASFWTCDAILPLVGKRCLYPNLSLPTLAALTPARHDVVLCDENVDEIDFACDADIVGVTGYTIHKPRILEIVREFRRRGKFVVAGGPFASLCPEDLRNEVDVVFVDEAEATWPQFLRDFAAGCHQAEYQCAEKPSLQDAPVPRFDLLPVDRYQSMTVQFARGCPFTCEFCDIIVLYGRRPRTKRVEQVMREVQACFDLGARSIFIVDDNFIGNKKEAKRLLEAIIEWQQQHGYPLEFNTEVSLNVAQDEELLRLMHAANFPSVFIGIESPRAASLQETHKLQNLREDVVGAVHRVQEAGIEVMAGMIVGFDHDDATIFAEQQRFLEDARIPIAMTGMLQAPPKTPLYRRLKDAGRLIAECVGDQFVFTNIVPERMSLQDLYRGYRQLLLEQYSYAAFRRRCMALLLSKRAPRRTAAAPSREDVATGMRIVASCILRASPQRAWFTLSILAETLLRRPTALKEALALAVLHKHFYEYTRDLCAQLETRLAPEARGPQASEPIRCQATPG